MSDETTGERLARERAAKRAAGSWYDNPDPYVPGVSHRA